ncbi:CBS domain-containing protein [Streptosporangium becharense]|uniref:CBS domain-containing protein n=1 Tax=Streptosporangium becharense TaxID=1816182 RepID=A0A7W9IAD0_9ACTN|nr:CBS domain-containing protein [Streptosporangium becharense]MBB2915293.1 CBS domain-containing protein [Streptosporangium becharense]MBB5817009.1 CBS domain-containing protein [Streptosporangium becharense]
MTMKVKDVMGAVAVAAHPEATFAELVATMRRFKVNAVAVVDADGVPVGVVSEEDLLLKETGTARSGSLAAGRGRHRDRDRAAGMTAGRIMSSPALTVTRETSVREAVRLMHDNRIKQLPVVDAVSGRIVGTVHQGDLLKIFARRAPVILAEVAAAVARLRLDCRSLAISVEDGVVRIGGRVARRSQLARLAEAAWEVEGIVELRVEAAYDEDDLAEIPHPRR